MYLLCNVFPVPPLNTVSENCNINCDILK